MNRTASLAELAAGVQDLLGELEVALVGHGDPLPALFELKRKWRLFKDAVLLEGRDGGQDAPPH